MKLRSIKAKLVLAVGILVSITITALITYTVIQSREHAIESMEEKSKDLARKYAALVKAEVEVAMDAARTMAQTFSAVKDPDAPLDLGRDPANTILKSVLKNNDSFFGTYTLWEPDAFDQMDAAYANLPGHDETGRFIPYWSKGNNGELILEPLLEYETDGIGDYYVLPKRTKREVVTAPYVYPVQGKEVTIVSLVAPVIYDNKFYGIAGVDLLLDGLQAITDRAIKRNDNSQICIIANNGTLVAVSNQPELAGKQLSEMHEDYTEHLSDIRIGSEAWERNEGYLTIFSPIHIGSTTTPWSIQIRVPYDMITAQATSHMLSLIIIGASLTILTLLTIYLIVGRFIQPLAPLAKVARKVAKGDMHYEPVKTADDEIGEVNKSVNELVESFHDITSVCEAVAMGNFNKSVKIRSDKDTLGKSINQMVDTLRQVVTQANAISNGDYTTEIVPRSDADELGVALSEMTIKLRNTIEENERENWKKTGQAKLNDQMRGEQKALDLAQKIVTTVATYLDAQIGAIYLADQNGVLKMVGSYAYSHRKGVSNEFKPGQGLVGQAALERKIILVTEVPEDYVAVHSGLGQAVAKNILVVPLVFDDQITGVIEIGSFQEFTATQVRYVEKSAENIAIALNAAESRTRLAELLEETQRQSEELQNQQLELKATNEELEQQTENLKRSEEILKSQQEELEEANSQLEDKTATLEEQKDQIEKSWQQIKEKSKQLELANKYKSEFLSNMSHELRTPLNSLLILAKMLLDNEQGNLTSEQVDSARVIYEGGNELLSLINEILDLSKIEAGKMEIIVDDFSISNLISDMEQSFEHVARNKGLEFNVNTCENLPEIIRTDGKRVKQVVKNFLSNAFKFTSKGSVTLNVERPKTDVNLQKSGLSCSNAIAISVSDTGIGIPEDKQEIILEAFQQADGTTNRTYGGTGLGLSISRELSRLLNGEVQLESELGKGSTFTLYLPETMDDGIQVKDAETDYGVIKHTKTQHKNKVQHQPSTKRITAEDMMPSDDREEISEQDKAILIIEDDPNFSKILVNMAHERNLKSLVARDGETGLKLANDYQPVAIILDIGLPGMDGMTVMDALKENSKTRNIPVHFMSAKDIADNGELAFSKGAIGYLTKPVSKEQLSEAFKRIENFATDDIKKLLVAEDDKNTRESIIKLVGGDNVEIEAVETGQQAYDLLKSKSFDCMVLDLGLPDMTGFELLSQMKNDTAIAVKPPVVVYSGKDLTREETRELEEYGGSVIVKGEGSPERLLDETSLFLHRVQTSLPAEQQKMVKIVHDKDSVLSNKKVLIVDDDMRNVFALSHALKGKEMNVMIAENGQKALDVLENETDIDVVLMDIMMPVMDGYETIRRIREQEKFWKLPILALTAKAMKGDREKCIEAGANDYLAKPIDIEKVLSMLRVWLYL